MPPEIWTTVLQNYGNNIDDFIHLWTQCRQVSRQFKKDVENTFIKQHLPVITVRSRTQIDEHSQLCYYIVFVETIYIGVSKDRETALFGELDADKKQLWAKWIKMSMRVYLEPKRHVRFRELALDVEMPRRFVLDEEGGIIFEIEWKKLLVDILKEGMRCRKYKAQKVIYKSQAHAS